MTPFPFQSTAPMSAERRRRGWSMTECEDIAWNLSNSRAVSGDALHCLICWWWLSWQVLQAGLGQDDWRQTKLTLAKQLSRLQPALVKCRQPISTKSGPCDCEMYQQAWNDTPAKEANLFWLCWCSESPGLLCTIVRESPGYELKWLTVLAGI